MLTVGVTTAGLGPSGITVPEHPGRAITTFNSISHTDNTEFTQYAATYDEYRVEAIILEFVPFSANPAGANELIVLSDYDNELSAGVLTSTQPAARYSTAMLASPTREFQYIYKPPPRRSFRSGPQPPPQVPVAPAVACTCMRSPAPTLPSLANVP